MSGVDTAVQQVPCGVLNTDFQPTLDPAVIHRFLIGDDLKPVALTTDEASAQLGDPIATLLLLQGTFPKSTDELLAGIQAATPEGDPLRTVQSFIVGEASQLPASADLQRKVSFLITLGGQEVDIFISTDDPAGTFIEAMGWDRAAQGFNYYRTVQGAWVFAGNSRHALSGPTERSGAFETHRSGNVVMKELRLPWVHWHSPTANIPDTALAEDDPRRSHPLFTGKDAGGAYVLEPLVMASIERWTQARFEQLTGADGDFERPARVVEQIVDTPTVNLASSQRESGGVQAGEPLDLPPTFFINERAFSHPALGLPAPPALAVDGALYLANLEQAGFHLEGFTAPNEGPQDNHFAFVVPEAAFEDFAALAKALEVGLITPRLAAALLMVDFPNPVFSLRRRALLARAPANATITGGTSDFSQEFVDRINAAAPNTDEGSGEREFAELWAVGEAFKAPFGERLNAYYTALQQKLSTQDGYNDIVRLADSRRRAVGAKTQLVEFDLLFAKTTLPDEQLEMRPDASVVVAAVADNAPDA